MKNIKFYLMSCLGLMLLCFFFSVEANAQMGRENTVKSPDRFGPPAQSDTQVKEQADSCRFMQKKITGGDFALVLTYFAEHWSQGEKTIYVNGDFTNISKKGMPNHENFGVEVKVTTSEGKVFSECVGLEQGGYGHFSIPLGPKAPQSLTVILDPNENIQNDENKNNNTMSCKPFMSEDLGGHEASAIYKGGYSGPCLLF